MPAPYFLHLRVVIFSSKPNLALKVGHKYVNLMSHYITENREIGRLLLCIFRYLPTYTQPADDY